MIDPICMYSPQPQPAERALSMRWRVTCEECNGAGWYPTIAPGTEDDYIPDCNERYCTCDAGKWRRIFDGTPPASLAYTEAP